MSSQGRVEYIHVAKESEATPRAVTEVRAIEGRGLEGDRYADRRGTYTETPGTGRHVTIIEAEQIEALERETDIRLAPGESRRNITTRGIGLNDLVDRELRVGEVVLRGMRLCEPCAHLQRLVGKEGVLEGLIHRAGLRCDIVTGGTIRVGDTIETL